MFCYERAEIRQKTQRSDRGKPVLERRDVARVHIDVDVITTNKLPPSSTGPTSAIRALSIRSRPRGTSPHLFRTTKMSARGGAGNIEAAKQAAKQQPTDLEANPVPYTPGPEPKKSSEQPGYARSGRGGAGNYHDPQLKEDAKSGDGIDSLGSAEDIVTKASEQPATNRKVGRGGAGNFVSGEQGEREAEEQEAQKRRERVKIEAEQGVNQIIAMPEKAKMAK